MTKRDAVTEHGPSAFVTELVRLQCVAGLSDIALDRAAGKSGNYWGRIKRGQLPAPPEATIRKWVDRLTVAGVSVSTSHLLELAARARIDPETRRWYEAQIGSDAQGRIRDLEAENNRLRTALEAVRKSIEGV
jgi:hypothetical protein